mmetsp:Transcript_14216/g.13737  ORF Transcript_14216/g.13737 Transcript_14216/m.13737 type:complete len:480 (+) Transcript_14216:122-1561(+)
MFSSVFSVESVSLAIGITLLSIYYVFLRETRKLPPITEHGMFEVIYNMTEGNSLDFQLQNMKDYGSIFRYSLPQIAPFVVVCDPDLARKILEEENEKPGLYKAMDGLTLNVESILTKSTYGGNHHTVRKCLAPSFSTTNIFSSLPQLHEKIDLLKKIFLQNEKDNISFDVAEIFPRLLMDMICTAMFDVDYHTLECEDGEGRQLLDNLNVAAKEFSTPPPFHSLIFWDKKLREGKAAALRLYESQKKLLDNYRANNTPKEIEKGVSIMAHLIKTPYPSDMERCADMTTFLLAGHETTSYSVSWNIIEVAKQPLIYDRIKKEIDLIIGEDVEHITSQHLSKLVYLDKVIKESMRLWPVAAGGSARLASKDIKFKDMIIPKGSVLSLPQYVLFRMGIQDPESFNPDRWDPDSPDLKQLNVSFLPFALGRRNCIGQNLAIFEMKLILATLYRSFRFELESVVEMDYTLTLKPKNAFLKVFSV